MGQNSPGKQTTKKAIHPNRKSPDSKTKSANCSVTLRKTKKQAYLVLGVNTFPAKGPNQDMSEGAIRSQI